MMPTFLEHTAAAQKGASIPGTWRAACSCGWSGKLYGARGALSTARAEVWGHLFDIEDMQTGA